MGESHAASPTARFSGMAAERQENGGKSHFPVFNLPVLMTLLSIAPLSFDLDLQALDGLPRSLRQKGRLASKTSARAHPDITTKAGCPANRNAGFIRKPQW